MLGERAVAATSSSAEPTFRLDTLLVLKGATWYGIAMAASMALEFVIQGLLASRLGPADFGLLSTGYQIFNVAVGLSLLGLPNAMTHFIPRQQQAGGGKSANQVASAGFWPSLICSLLVGITLFLLAEPISITLFNQPALSPVMRLFAIAVPGSALAQLLVGVLRGLKLSRQASMLNSAYERAARLGFVVFFLSLGLGLGGAATAYLAASVVVCALALHSALNRPGGVRLVPPKPAVVGELLTYSWPLLLSLLLNRAGAAVQPLMLLYFLDSASAGIFTVAAFVPQGFALVLSAFTFLYFPVASGSFGRGDSVEVKRIYRLTTNWTLMAVWPASLLVLAVPETVLGFFGARYEEGAWALRLLIVSALVNVGTGMLGPTLLASAHTRTYMLLDFVGTSVSITFGLLLIPRFGLLGAAVARVATSLAWNGTALISVYRLCKIQPFDRQYGRVLLVGLICLLPLYPAIHLVVGLTPWAIFPAAIAYLALAGVVMIRLRLLDPDSLMIIEEVLRAGKSLVRSIRASGLRDQW